MNETVCYNSWLPFILPALFYDIIPYFFSFQVRENRATRDAERERLHREREARRQAREEAQRREQEGERRRRQEARRQEEMVQQEMVRLRHETEERRNLEKLARQMYSNPGNSKTNKTTHLLPHSYNHLHHAHAMSSYSECWVSKISQSVWS